MSALLFTGASQVVTCAGPGRARRGDEMRDASVRSDCAVLAENGKITAIGHEKELRQRAPGADVVDCAGCIVTPGLVDSHTHALFASPRAVEQELRAAGLDYMEIARAGGGIHSSVRSLRAATDDRLHQLAVERLEQLASFGTTTVEVKSGYGLSTEHELRSLRIIAQLGRELPIRIIPTWLGAHEIPMEFRSAPEGRSEYIELLTQEMLPQVSSERLARFADVFCEPGVFTVPESRAILGAAREHGLGLKLHADELNHSGGAELAAELGAVSADHLAAVSDRGIRAMARAGVVATLLPGTMLFLGRDSRAPARQLIESGVPVALATDFNPGTSPTASLPLMLTLAVSQLRMSAAEAIIAATVNGAAALGLAGETGQLSPGYDADVAVFRGDDYRELPYWYGNRLCRGVWSRGKQCYPFKLRA